MTGNAHRLVDDGMIVYVMAYEDHGRPVVYRQDPETFQTTRETVTPEKARTLRERAATVPDYVTPAWADPQAPAAASARTAP